MRLLLVSGKEYTQSNRGFDFITTYLGRQNIVDHLFFYTREEKADKKVSENITQKYFIDRIHLYRDKFKYFMPGFLIDYLFRIMVRKSRIDFSNYDYVILESGYPILLAEYINNKIIYRQSDSIGIAFNTERYFFKKKEKKLFRKAVSISTALLPKFHPKEASYKTSYWKSGFIQSEIQSVIKKNQIVYMGGVEIEYKLIKKLAQKYSNFNFVVIGNYKKKIKLPNVIFTGYLNFSKYKNYIYDAKIFFYPISKKYLKKLRRTEITSKFYLPISLGIPFITRAYGLVQNNDNEKKIFVYRNEKEAFSIFDLIINKQQYSDFVISQGAKEFLRKQTITEKEKELKIYFESIFK